MRGTLLLGLALVGTPLAAQTAAPTYLVGVVSESGDIVTWLRPVAGTSWRWSASSRSGIMPADIDGPHNITVSADQQSYYITIAHGVPYGTLWRLDAATDTVIGRAQVELFPTTITLTPDGEWAWVANSDFHGDRPRVNSVFIVHAPTMTKVTDLPACDMPHGVKVNHAGTKVYVSCMHSDEILAARPRHLRDHPARRPARAWPCRLRRRRDAGHGPRGAGAPARRAPKGPDVPPPTADVTRSARATFVSVSPDDSDGSTWPATTATSCRCRTRRRSRLVKAVPLGAGAYNVEPSPDGRW